MALTFRRLRTRIASGIVALVPIVVTVLVIRFVFSFTSGILLPLVDPALEEWPVEWRAAVSLVTLLVGVYLLGELATHVVGRRVLALGEALLLKVPFVKVIYGASKQVVADKDVVRTDYTVEEGVKMIMSLGVLIPNRAAGLP